MLRGETLVNKERIEKLEIRMSHLENFLNQLNDIVLENGQQMDAMKKDQSNLRQQMNDVTNSMPGPESVKPPHY